MSTQLQTETMTYLTCPHCGERAGRVDHLFDRLPGSWGPWWCDACGHAYAFTLVSRTEAEVEASTDQPVRIKTLDLLKIEPRETPVFVVVHASWREADDGKDYFYNEHTCPTNWTANIEAIIDDGDTDPHGVAKFVRSVRWSPSEEDTDPDLQMLFPEAFGGIEIDGEMNSPSAIRLAGKD